MSTRKKNVIAIAVSVVAVIVVMTVLYPMLSPAPPLPGQVYSSFEFDNDQFELGDGATIVDTESVTGSKSLQLNSYAASFPTLAVHANEPFNYSTFTKVAFSVKIGTPDDAPLVDSTCLTIFFARADYTRNNYAMVLNLNANGLLSITTASGGYLSIMTIEDLTTWNQFSIERVEGTEYDYNIIINGQVAWTGRGMFSNYPVVEMEMVQFQAPKNVAYLDDVLLLTVVE